MPKRETPSPLRRIAIYTKPHLLTLVASGVLRLTNVGLGIVLLGLAGHYVGGAVADGLVVTTRQWALLVGLGVAKAVARYLEQVTGHVGAFRILDTLRGRIYEWFAGRPAALRASSDSGDIVSRAMADVELVEVYFAHTLVPVAVAVPVVVTLSIVAGSAAGVATGIALGAALAAAGFLVPLVWQRLNGTLAAGSRAASGRLSAEVSETLGGLTDIVTAGAEERWGERLARCGETLAETNARLARRNALKDIAVDLLLISALFIVGLGALGAEAPVATVWALTCAVAGSFGAVLAVSRAVDDLPRSEAAAARVLEVAGATPAIQESARPRHDSLPAPLDIALQNVTIDFGEGRGLRELNLALPQGTHLFVAGRSGAGKSTLARLALGLERPDDGQVLLGGEPLPAYRETELRTALSASLQRSGLVRGTVLENVALGSRRGLGREDGLPTDLTPDERGMVDDVTGFARLCEDLSLGEDTFVGGAHEELSGGQQRRVAIARMVARNPSIVVLDEAFVGLDHAAASDLRREVLSWARSERRTVVEISHELELAFEADRVIVIEDGLVVEDGTPEILMTAGGAFATLVRERRNVSNAEGDPQGSEKEVT